MLGLRCQPLARPPDETGVIAGVEPGQEEDHLAPRVREVLDGAQRPRVLPEPGRKRRHVLEAAGGERAPVERHRLTDAKRPGQRREVLCGEDLSLLDDGAVGSD